MQNARNIGRPIPLVCTECGRLIGADEECTWHERTVDEAKRMFQRAAGESGFEFGDLHIFAPGAVGKHVKCPPKEGA